MKPGYRAATAIVFVALLLAHTPPAQARQGQNQLAITKASVDTTTAPWILTITGQNFDARRDPAVFLGGEALALVAPPTDTMIRARVPVLQPGTYLLIVARGSGDNNSDSLDLVIGTKGPKGDAGPAGAPGPSGVQGVQGPVGLPGLTGPIGLAGPRGIDGPTGPMGTRGDQGATGPTGPAGVQGPTGPQGRDGVAGPQGEQGPQGAVGPAGPEGPQGVAGPQGSIGERGLQGSAGPQGAQGPQGSVGPRGPRGLQGVTGAEGPPGGNSYFQGAFWVYTGDGYTSETLWTVPDGVTRVFIELWGGGGGGGGAGLPATDSLDNIPAPGGGGGTGGYTARMVEITQSSYTLVLGHGGQGGAPTIAIGATGGAGGDTRFGSLVAYGGQGGRGGTAGWLNANGASIEPGLGGDGGGAAPMGSGPFSGMIAFGAPGEYARDFYDSDPILPGGKGGVCTVLSVSVPCLNNGGDGGPASPTKGNTGAHSPGYPGSVGQPGAIRISW